MRNATLTDTPAHAPGETVKCRFCGGEAQLFLDLGMSPLCESFVPPDGLNRMEAFYPLRVHVCNDCRLVQLQEYVSPAEIFSEYAYFSSYSDSYLEHGRRYAEEIASRLGLGKDSLVVELASNDGYLLRNFVSAGIPCLGIEPAANVAKAAEEHGVPTLIAFFDEAMGRRMAEEGRQADLVIGNNVLAQVPDLNSFVAGIRHLLKPEGVATIEFPHIMHLIEGNQFDTIYHEHFSYFSFNTAERIFAAHGMRLFDVEEIWTHGGSLRIHACRAESARPDTPQIAELRLREREAGYEDVATYQAFAEQVRETKRRLLDFLIKARREGASIVAYGAPGKGNTLLNYCGIRTDFLDFAADRNPYKHGKFTPGTHIPIFPPDKIDEARPDYVLILAWNLRDEIMRQMSHIRDWDGRFVIPIPQLEVI